MSTSTPVFVALLIAVSGGVAIAMQSSLINAFGSVVGPVRTAFFIHVGGTVVGAVMLGLLALRGDGPPLPANITRLSWVFLTAGLMGMLTLPAIAVSFPRTGLVAGQLALIGGQTLIALVVDGYGLAGSDPIPLSWRRVVGLLLLFAATYLILPQTN
jgi:bacterial/archaeal transporter family-2 protein